MRVGIGFDVHRFEEGRDLILGGVKIPYEKGLLGHSDADVLLHAIVDAILGAANLGDIGALFPDTDDAYKGADSGELLREAYRRVMNKGYHLENLDAVVMAQKPKLRPFIEQIQNRIAYLFSVDSEQISVKATTTEKLGFTGREEGIAAQAVVLLIRKV